MATPSFGVGLAQGYESGLDRIRRRKAEDQQAADQRAELQYRRDRRAVTDAQADTTFQQGQEDRTLRLQDQQQAREQNVLNTRAKMLQDSDQLNQQHQQAISQAEHEGMAMVANSLQSGVDPQVVMNRYNELVAPSGGRKIAGLQHDPKTGAIVLTGEQGKTFNGTLDQFRAVFGVQKAAPKLTSVAGTARLVATDETGKPKVLLDVDPSVAAKNNAAAAAAGKGSAGAGGGRKLATYNPESTAQQAAQAVRTYFKGSRDPLGNWTYDNASDQQRGTAAEGLATQFFAEKGIEGQNYGAGKVAELAAKAASSKLSKAEAEDRVKKAGYKPDSPEFNAAVDKAVRDSDIRAAQIWKRGVADMEAERKQEQQDGEWGKYFDDGDGADAESATEDQDE